MFLKEEHENRDSKLELISKIFYQNSKQNQWQTQLDLLASPSSHALEIGSGSGLGHQNGYRPACASLTGIDLDERVLNNPTLDRSHVLDAYSLSEVFSAHSFDLIYSHMVIEHIENCESFLNEQVKCLKPTGVIFHSTVSSFYISSVLNRLLPTDVKNWLIKRLGSGRSEEDIFPAFYKMNSPRSIRKVCRSLNLDARIIHYDTAPGYLRRSLLLMLLYTIIHKPVSWIFPCLRPGILIILTARDIHKN
jgi:SAM-dependent methyltransferase